MLSQVVTEHWPVIFLVPLIANGLWLPIEIMTNAESVPRIAMRGTTIYACSLVFAILVLMGEQLVLGA